MKILTILGTRPEIIRLSRIIPLLDENFDHLLVHTGQNFDEKLSDIFFDELEVRKPNYFLKVRGDTYASQITEILKKAEEVLLKERPDKVLILGDTNSGLSAIIAKRLNIPVYHMEAGNRCFDDRVPEELNRKIIDHSSTVLLPYTKNSQQFLLNEGFNQEKIIVTGNPIYEVLKYYEDRIDQSNILNTYNLSPKNYMLATIHRAENVDDKSELISIFSALNSLAIELKTKMLLSLHPRTEEKLKNINFEPSDFLIYSKPFGFFDFIKLQKHASLVLTDSGTVQEESCILKVPNVTVRKTTERPETVECGSNVVVGTKKDNIINNSLRVIDKETDWNPPEEYLEKSVSAKIINILSK